MPGRQNRELANWWVSCHVLTEVRALQFFMPNVLVGKGGGGMSIVGDIDL